MALTSTLFTGLSGLNVNQTRLNVVGNNIANVNTVAFKSSRALFKPQFYVTDAAGAPPSASFGGQNPSQRGLGAMVAAIEKNFSPGSIEATGKMSDMAIDGDGFFVVQGKEQRFTRDGTFTLNQSNQLVTSAGDYVQGFGVDDNGNVIPGQLQNVDIPLGSLTRARATERAEFQGNLNADGAIGSGASILNSQALTDISGGVPAAPTPGTLLTDLRDASETTTPLVASGDVLTISGTRGGRDLPDLTFTIDASSTLGDLLNFLNQGLGIETTASPGGPVPGATLEALATDTADSRHIVITGNVGVQTFAFTDGVNAAGVASAPVGESVYTSFPAYDSLGTPLNVNLTMVLENKSETGTSWRFFATSADDTDALTFDPASPTHPGMILGTGTLSFDNNGKLLTSTNSSIQITRQETGASNPLGVTLDFSQMTALTSGESRLLMSEQDGTPMGTLTSFSVGANGLIIGAFDNGLTSTLGQIAVATFDNASGLVDKGGNMFIAGANSGVPKITGPLTMTAGAIRAGALELSNVDLSNEFINLIIASTGFSASSRVISASDQLLTELLNTSR
jgi:flagellar hook protein FlgE